uniref:Uncharacterized protein n=1 Tax=Romanomermis culicivorax TaxID=13658 RepID=A0A915HL40_ROMCU
IIRIDEGGGPEAQAPACTKIFAYRQWLRVNYRGQPAKTSLPCRRQFNWTTEDVGHVLAMYPGFKNSKFKLMNVSEERANRLGNITSEIFKRMQRKICLNGKKSISMVSVDKVNTSFGAKGQRPWHPLADCKLRKICQGFLQIDL